MNHADNRYFDGRGDQSCAVRAPSVPWFFLIPQFLIPRSYYYNDSIAVYTGQPQAFGEVA